MQKSTAENKRYQETLKWQTVTTSQNPTLLHSNITDHL
jgi:hypothetical protein